MWRYRITRLLSRKYPELVMPDALAAEGSSKREWNRFLDNTLPPRLECQRIPGDG